MGTPAAIIRDLPDGIEVTYRHYDGFFRNIYHQVKAAIEEGSLDDYFVDTEGFSDFSDWEMMERVSFNTILWVKANKIYLVVEGEFLVAIDSIRKI